MRLKHAAVGQVSTFWQIRTSAALSRAGTWSLRKRGTCSCTIAPGRLSGVVNDSSPPGPTYRSSPASQSHMMVLEAFPVAACDGMLDPPPIASRDQELDVDAAESLGVGVIDNGAHSATLNVK